MPHPIHVRDADKIRYGWPFLAIVIAALMVVFSLDLGSGWLTLFLLPAAAIGYGLGSRASREETLSGFRNPGSTGLAAGIGIAIAMLFGSAISASGPIGGMVIPCIGILGSGYLLGASRRLYQNVP